MSDFDEESLWNELQEEEKRNRLQHTQKSKHKDIQFWRKKTRRTKNISSRQILSNSDEKDEKENKMKLNIKNKVQNIKHAMNILNDPNAVASKKLNCVQFIGEYLNNIPINIQHKSNSMEILKVLIKTFVTPSEPLRSLSIDIVYKHIGNNNNNNNKYTVIWDYSTSIKYIIPILVHCVLSNNYIEKSEEIRFKFVCLLEKIINLCQNEDELKPICGDLIAILIKLLNDKYYKINIKICNIFILLSNKIRLNNISRGIIENSLNLLSHRHSSVRIHTIKLIECMLLNGGHEAIQTLTGFREYNVVPLQWWFGKEIRVNYFGALCRHPKYIVRKAFYNMIINIMTNMYERYDYKTLLLSYLLTGLQDNNKQIQQDTFNAIEQIGKLHELDDYNDLKKTLFFEKEAEEITKKHFKYNTNDQFKLPFPFKHRPCLGSRMLIREHFNRIINQILNEFNDWKKECKQMAMVLVRNMIIYTEEYCTQNTETLLETFSNYIEENDIIKECCYLIGRYIYPIIWINYLCDKIYYEFNSKWIIILNQLILYCPLIRLNQIIKQIISLIEYSVPRIELQNKTKMKPIVENILIKLNNTLQKCVKFEENEFDDNDFQFSSEYCGFEIEIVDQRSSSNISAKNTKKLTPQERIQILMDEIN